MPNTTALPTLNLVGAGRVAQTLASLWQAQNTTFAIQDVLTTSMHTAQAACSVIGAGQPVAQMQAMRDADVWMLAVPDAQLAACAQALAVARTDQSAQQGAANAPPPTVFHCSGAEGAAVLAPLAALGWQVASAHW